MNTNASSRTRQVTKRCHWVPQAYLRAFAADEARSKIWRFSKHEGDLMRDPEMCFELGFAGGAHLNPFYLRNDFVGIEQWSRFIRDGSYCFHPQLHEQHESFAKLWEKNLAAQRFVEAFTDECILG